MATIHRVGRRAPYVDTPELPSTPKPKKISKRDKTPRLMKLANRHLQEQPLFASEPDDRREMSREDIANVEFINSSDLDSVFDSLIEAVSFQHDLEDCECRWNIADVDTDMMDLSDPAPTLVIHDELSLDADERGVPAIGQREMSKADRCNVDMASLIALNLVPQNLSDRFALGGVDPETTDLSADSLADYQELIHEPIEFQLKTEVPPPLKTETAWPMSHRRAEPTRDVRSFRSKRK